MPILETAMGLENAREIGAAHPDVTALLFGGEDLATDLGVQRTKQGTELAWGRARVINAAKALKLMAVDTVYTDIDDLEGLEAECLSSRQLGFDAKGMISPRHIAIVNRCFQPSAEDVEWAKRVLAAERTATREGKGAVSLDGKMVDMPVIMRAKQIMVRRGLTGEEDAQ
jgi:citrate lyase subunit beta/citryl-CoA lyase